MHPRIIAHLDLDCFFVSCERTKNPALIGKPVVVGGSAKSRGVVSSASYEARKFGVRSAMPSAQAKRLCPQAVFLSTDFDCYSYYSHRVKRFLEEVAPVVEQASIDEFYLDLTGCERLYPDWLVFGAFVKECLNKNLKLPSSVAIASNKLISKIAANEVKPDGLIHVERGREAEFLAPLPVNTMPGVGKVTAREIDRLGFKTLGEVAKAPEVILKRHLGSWGAELKKLALGMDDGPVIPWEDPKSIGRETTFEQDANDRQYLLAVLSSFVEECAAELRHYGFSARTITVKFRLPSFKTYERSKTIQPTHYEKEIFQTVETIFLNHWKSDIKLRLVGMSVSHFEKGGKTPELFVDPNEVKRQQLFQQVDAIRGKYGLEAIRIGSSLRHQEEKL